MEMKVKSVAIRIGDHKPGECFYRITDDGSVDRSELYMEEAPYMSEPCSFVSLITGKHNYCGPNMMIAPVRAEIVVYERQDNGNNTGSTDKATR